MKHQAFYKDLRYTPNPSLTILYFKVDGINFSVSFGCSFNQHRRYKQMGNTIMKRLIRNSRIISMCDNLSNYAFDSADGHSVNISENERLVGAIIKMKEELKKDIYKVRDLKHWKPKLNQELYFKMYK